MANSYESTNEAEETMALMGMPPVAVPDDPTTDHVEDVVAIDKEETVIESAKEPEKPTVEPTTTDDSEDEDEDDEEDECPLTPEEMDELRDKMVDLHMDIDTVTAEKKTAVENYNKRIASLTAQASQVAADLRDAIYTDSVRRIKRKQKARRKPIVLQPRPDAPELPPTKPVEAFAGLEPGQTFRVSFGEPGAQHIVRVVALADDTVVVVDGNDVSTRINSSGLE